MGQQEPDQFRFLTPVGRRLFAVSAVVAATTFFVLHSLDKHFFFDAGAVMVAASLLLAIAAVARTVWLRARPAGATKSGVGHSSVSSSWADSLLLLAVALSWYNLGGGWVVHLVCYPIYPDMSEYGAQAFHAYSHGYLSRWPTALWPLGLMCLTWAMLLWVPLRNVPRRLIWVIVGLCVAFVAVTPPAAFAQGHMLEQGFSKDQYDRLMLWSSFRTAIFTLIAVLALVVMRRRLMSTESRSA
jgi:hypothetical protein